MQIFQDDDPGYREWLWSNLSGYVVNAQRGSNPGEPIRRMMAHHEGSEVRSVESLTDR